MAAVLYKDGTENVIYSGDMKIVSWKSPSTMDSADTVVLPTPPTGKSLALTSCWDVTGADAVTHTLSTYTVTIDASGGTTDHTYVLSYVIV